MYIWSALSPFQNQAPCRSWNTGKGMEFEMSICVSKVMKQSWNSEEEIYTILFLWSGGGGWGVIWKEVWSVSQCVSLWNLGHGIIKFGHSIALEFFICFNQGLYEPCNANWCGLSVESDLCLPGEFCGWMCFVKRLLLGVCRTHARCRRCWLRRSGRWTG